MKTILFSEQYRYHLFSLYTPHAGNRFPVNRYLHHAKDLTLNNSHNVIASVMESSKGRMIGDGLEAADIDEILDKCSGWVTGMKS